MKQKLFVRSELETKFGSLPTAEGKKKLADYAMKHHGVKLARNKSFENMMNDLEEAVNATFEEARAEAGDAKEQIDMEERVDLSDAVEIDPDLMDKDESENEFDVDEADETIAPEVTEPTEKAEEPTPLAAPGEIRSIKDIPVEDQEKIRRGLETGEIVVGAPVTPVTPVEAHSITFPEGYQPKYRLVGPEGRAFINIPYWVYDWMQGRPWRSEISECPYDKELLKSLAFYIERDGSVAIRESRNSKFIVIS